MQVKIQLLERQSGNLQLLLHSPSGCHSRGGARLEPGARTAAGWVAGTQRLSPDPLFRGCRSGCSVENRGLTCRPTAAAAPGFTLGTGPGERTENPRSASAQGQERPHSGQELFYPFLLNGHLVSLSGHSVRVVAAAITVTSQGRSARPRVQIIALSAPPGASDLGVLRPPAPSRATVCCSGGRAWS